jgi:TolB-like protein/Flp pilus assembly protein TadD
LDSADANRAQQAASAQPDDLLDSWKAIASYLKRDVRTVRRREAEQGLPVRRHQHQKGASVYAYRSELDSWWKGEKEKLDKTETMPGDQRDLMAAPAEQVSAERPHLVAAVAAPKPNRRYFWAIFPLLLIALAVASYWALRNQSRARISSPARIMLAVLPFQNLTGDASQDFVSDGLTEELSTQISQLQHDRLGVIARTSAMTYKNTSKPVSEIARELGVDYVLEGSVRRWGDRARISAQLIDAHNQTHVWAQNFESDQRNVLVLQNEMAQSVARSIDLALLASPAANPRPIEPAAHDFYLKGRYQLALRTRDSLRESVHDFEQAAAQDPAYARAYAGLADAQNLIAFYGFDPSLEGAAKAKASALKALELDPSLSSAHAALAYTQFMWRENWPNAEREFQRALELDDNDVHAHQWFALYLVAQGRNDAALNQMRYARTLDPVSPASLAALAYVEYLARDYDSAVQHAQTALRLNPNSMTAHAVLGWAYTEQKNYPGAIAELTAASKLSGGVPVYLCAAARAYALSGNPAEARKLLTQVTATLDRPRGEGSALAAVYLAFGDREKALHWLEKTAPGDVQANWLRVDPAFDPLRQDPRFQAVLNGVGQPPP